MEPNFHSVNGQKRMRTTEEDAASLYAYIDASKTTSDAAVRTENLQACNNMLMEEGYVQPVYNSVNIFCYNNQYTNITRDPGGTFYVCDFDYAA